MLCRAHNQVATTAGRNNIATCAAIVALRLLQDRAAGNRAWEPGLLSKPYGAKTDSVSTLSCVAAVVVMRPRPTFTEKEGKDKCLN